MNDKSDYKGQIEKSLFYDDLYINSESNPDDKIVHPQHSNLVKIPFSRQFLRQAETSEVEVDQCKIISYKVDKQFDHLEFSFVTLLTNKITVKKEYQDKCRIKWTDDLLHNVFKKGYMYFDNKKLPGFDNISLRIEANKKNLYKYTEKYDINIGNNYFLNRWTSEENNHTLPPFELSDILPWFYMKQQTFNLPIFLIRGHLSQLEHRCVVDLDVCKLLQMQILKKDNKWHRIKFKKEYVDMEEKMLDKPKLWSFYSNTTDDKENVGVKCKEGEDPALPNLRCLYSDPVRYPKGKIYYCDDWIQNDDTNLNRLGNNCGIECSSNALLKELYWMVENTEMDKYNIYNNFSTNPESPLNGFSPIKHSTLKVGQNKEFEMLPGFITENMTYVAAGYKPPKVPGINLYSFSGKQGFVKSSERGLVDTNGDKIKLSLSIYLNNTNPYKMDNENNDSDFDSEDSNGTKNKKGEFFKLKTRILCSRAVIFYPTGKLDNDQHEVFTIKTIPPIE